MGSLENGRLVNLFKTFTLTWWQAAFFKAGTWGAGISVGTYWHDFFGLGRFGIRHICVGETMKRRAIRHSSRKEKRVLRMKKSGSIRLVLLGGASVVLAACDDGGLPSKDAHFYPSVNECTADLGAKACEDAKAAADKAHVAEAPRFDEKQQCEQEFGSGNCESRQEAGGGSFFMPMMMGYMVGSMMRGGGFSQPVYRGPGNTAVMPSGGRMLDVGRFDGANAGARPGFRPAAQIAPVSRGGFGSTAMDYRSTSGG